jgi:hypothetical protein
VTEAHTHQHFRYQTIRQLVERTPVRPVPSLATDDPAIRPMTQYVGGFLTMNAWHDRLRHLRLSGMVDALPGRVAQAEAAPLPHLEFLGSSRMSSPDAPIGSSRRLKQAGITVMKALADFDWSFNRRSPKPRCRTGQRAVCPGP